MICGVVATSISGCGVCTVCGVVCDSVAHYTAHLRNVMKILAAVIIITQTVQLTGQHTPNKQLLLLKGWSRIHATYR